jgi:hypothetical protein
MNTNDEVGAVLQKYAAMGDVQSVQQVEQDFDTVAQQAPVEEVTSGLTDAIRSDQTSSFGQIVGQAFAQADSSQKAAMLNQLLQGVSPEILAALKVTSIELSIQEGESAPRMTADQAAQISTEHFEQLADGVEKANPGIVEMMSFFYVKNPELAKPLGATVLGMAMDNVAQRL